MGGSHTGARAIDVGLVVGRGAGGENVDTGGGQMGGCGTIGRPRGQHIVGIGGRYGDLVGEIECCGVGGGRSTVVIVSTVVASSSHKQMTFCANSFHGIVQGLRIPSSTPRVRGNSGTLITAPEHALNGIGQIPGAGSTHKLAWQDADIPIETSYAFIVVSNGTNDACNVGTMSVVVHGVGLAGDGVVAGEDIGGKVGVCIVDSSVYHTYFDGRGTRGDVPGGRGADFGDGPHGEELGVGGGVGVGGREGLRQEVRFGVQNIWIRVETFEGGREVFALEEGFSSELRQALGASAFVEGRGFAGAVTNNDMVDGIGMGHANDIDGL